MIIADNIDIIALFLILIYYLCNSKAVSDCDIFTLVKSKGNIAVFDQSFCKILICRRSEIDRYFVC